MDFQSSKNIPAECGTLPREQNIEHKLLFLSTLFPADKTLLKGE
jgi:hypothetical protein